MQILDCDSVYSISSDTWGSQSLNDPVLRQFKDVFTGLGELPGEYAIQIQPNSVPVVNPPRQLPVSLLRRRVKSELDAMVEKQIIAPVTKPTQWVSSMVVAQKKDGRVCICLDPQSLNNAIMRSHHPLPTIEEVTICLTQAK